MTKNKQLTEEDVAGLPERAPTVTIKLDVELHQQHLRGICLLWGQDRVATREVAREFLAGAVQKALDDLIDRMIATDLSRSDEERERAEVRAKFAHNARPAEDDQEEETA